MPVGAILFVEVNVVETPPLSRRSKMNTTILEASSVVSVAARNRPRSVADATAVDRAPRLLLRAEAALVLAGALIVFHRLGASWWVFAALSLAPDLSFIGYVAGPKMGAKVYNAVHTYLAPGALALVGVLLPSVLPLAAIWVAHIAADRVMGYGLKYPTGFGDTHLGDPGKKRF
jgi:hypothetical protein